MKGPVPIKYGCERCWKMRFRQRELKNELINRGMGPLLAGSGEGNIEAFVARAEQASSFTRGRLYQAAICGQWGGIDMFNGWFSVLYAEQKHSKLVRFSRILPREFWNTRTHVLVARALTRSKKYDEALEVMDSLDRQRWDDKAYVTAVDIFKRREDYGRAMDLLESIPGSLRGPAAYRLALVVGNRLGDPGRGIRYFEGWPHDRIEWSASICNPLAYAYYSLGRFDSAREVLHQRLGLDQWDNACFDIAAKIYLREGKLDDARLLLDRLPRQKWDRRLYHTAARIENHRKNFQEAKELLQELSARFWWEKEAKKIAAVTFVGLGMEQYALKLLYQVGKENWNIRCRMTAAQALFQLGRTEEAVDMFFSSPEVKECSFRLLERMGVSMDNIDYVRDLYGRREFLKPEMFEKMQASLRSMILRELKAAGS